MKQKMTGKQAVKGGMDLNDFIKGADPSPQAQNTPVEAVQAPSVAHAGEKAKRGRGAAPKAREDVKNKNLQVRLTEKEYSKLKSEAGLVPVATYIREKMKEKGII